MLCRNHHVYMHAHTVGWEILHSNLVLSHKSNRTEMNPHSNYLFIDIQFIAHWFCLIGHFLLAEHDMAEPLTPSGALTLFSPSQNGKERELDLLIENMGRMNFDTLFNERKGEVLHGLFQTIASLSPSLCRHPRKCNG